MEYLSDIEKVAIETFCKNDVAREAVRKVFLHTIYSQGTLKSGSTATPKNWVFSFFAPGKENLTNEQVGEKVRAAVEGLGFLDAAFKKLEEFKTATPVPTPYGANPGE